MIAGSASGLIAGIADDHILPIRHLVYYNATQYFVVIVVVVVFYVVFVIFVVDVVL